MTKPILLIVEDELSQLDRLIDLFEPFYEVLSAKDGRSAVDIYSNSNPDDICAVLLDVRLPDISAFEVLYQFEQISFPAVPPTVIQTGYDDDQWRQELLGEYRALSYLNKPYSSADVLRAVEQAIHANPFVYKRNQIDERMLVMTKLNAIRYQLFYQVNQLPIDQQEHWMPQIVALFKHYSTSVVEESHDSSFRCSHTGSKKSVKKVIDLFQALHPYFQLPPVPRFQLKIAYGSPADVQKLSDILSGEQLLPLKEDSLIVHPQFDVSLLGVDDCVGEEDFIVAKLGTDHDRDVFNLFSEMSARKIAQVIPPYGIALADLSHKKSLEEAVLNGALFGFLCNDNFEACFRERMIKFANRRFEIQVLDLLGEVSSIDYQSSSL